jgi:hypothetical protein
MGLKSGQMLVKWELGKMGGCNGNLTHMVSSNVFVGAGGTIFLKLVPSQHLQTHFWHPTMYCT